MTLDVAQVKRRRTVMMVANVLAALIALASIVAYFQLQLGWALIPFVVALAGGFAAQIWFIAGLKGPADSGNSSARERAKRGN